MLIVLAAPGLTLWVTPTSALQLQALETFKQVDAHAGVWIWPTDSTEQGRLCEALPSLEPASKPACLIVHAEFFATRTVQDNPLSRWTDNSVGSKPNPANLLIVDEAHLIIDWFLTFRDCKEFIRFKNDSDEKARRLGSASAVIQTILLSGSATLKDIDDLFNAFNIRESAYVFVDEVPQSLDYGQYGPVPCTAVRQSPGSAKEFLPNLKKVVMSKAPDGVTLIYTTSVRLSQNLSKCLLQDPEFKKFMAAYNGGCGLKTWYLNGSSTINAKANTLENMATGKIDALFYHGCLRSWGGRPL